MDVQLYWCIVLMPLVLLIALKQRGHKLDIHSLEVQLRKKFLLKEVRHNLNASRLAIVSSTMCPRESQGLHHNLESLFVRNSILLEEFTHFGDKHPDEKRMFRALDNYAHFAKNVACPHIEVKHLKLGIPSQQRPLYDVVSELNSLARIAVSSVESMIEHQLGRGEY